MSDIAGAPSPDSGPAPLAPAMQTTAEAAAGRLAVLKTDAAWSAKYLAGGAAERNEFHTLHELIHTGGRSDADQAALAQSIKLERTPTLAAAERQRHEAETAAAATRPNIPHEIAGKLTPEEVGDLRNDIANWASGLQLPPSTTRTVLSRFSEQGPAVARMSPEDRAVWLQRQEQILIGAAGTKERADAWRKDAEGLLKGSKYNLENSPILSDAFVIRHLAIVAGARRK